MRYFTFQGLGLTCTTSDGTTEECTFDGLPAFLTENLELVCVINEYKEGEYKEEIKGCYQATKEYDTGSAKTFCFTHKEHGVSFQIASF